MPRRVVAMSVALEYADERWWLARGLEPELRRWVVPERFYAWISIGEETTGRLSSGADLAHGLTGMPSQHSHHRGRR